MHDVTAYYDIIKAFKLFTKLSGEDKVKVLFCCSEIERKFDEVNKLMDELDQLMDKAVEKV